MAINPKVLDELLADYTWSMHSRNGPREGGSARNHLVTPETLG